jgi:hypothetical protein
MLERKRVLRPQPSPDKSTLIYERAGTGETFIVADPNLSLTDLVAVQEEVSAMLSGLSAPPSADTEVPPEEPSEEVAGATGTNGAVEAV